MFRNMGSKIRVLAMVICWIGIIISLAAMAVVLLFGLGALDSFHSLSALRNAFAGQSAASVVVQGVLIGVVGTLISWVGSFLLCGFGELIDHAREASERLEALTRDVNRLNDSVETLRAQTESIMYHSAMGMGPNGVMQR